MTKIDFPDNVVFETELDIHQIYLNRGNHVGNGQYVELCNETSLRFFNARGVPEYTVGQQVLINTELTLQLKSEARYLDRLCVELAAGNFHRCGCDLFYRLTKVGQQNEPVTVALAKFSMLTFDYKAGKVVSADSDFQTFFTAI